jgi:UDP-N-acetylglucosamine diphosphorylase/glucosamine-1-phosphate N-acetyltransferase
LGRVIPLTDLKFGFFSIKERWVRIFELRNIDNTFLINPLFLPSIKFLEKFDSSKNYFCKGELLLKSESNQENIEIQDPIILNNLANILEHSEHIIGLDFYLSEDINNHINDKFSFKYSRVDCFFGKNVELRNCTINAQKGHVIIGDDVEIMEYAVIHGPCVIGAKTKIAPHTFIRANTIIGENCFVGGEIKNSIILSNTNKGHYGYLGDSIIGEFCNLGAGTTSSNLKNNFSEIKIYSIENQNFETSGKNKLGTFMGEFSMTSVNTILNTGTTVGVHAHVFGEQFYPKFMADFSWKVTEKYKETKWQRTAQNLLLKKGKSESEIQKLMLKLDALYKKANSES